MKYLLAIIPLFATQVALAESQYVVGSTWEDSTSAQEAYNPVYDAEIKVNGGNLTEIGDLPTTSFTSNLMLKPGDNIEVRVRARNTPDGPAGEWSGWESFTIQEAVKPGEQINIIITVRPATGRIESQMMRTPSSGPARIRTEAK